MTRARMKIEDIAALIKEVPDFPKKGIIFKDITPILQNAFAFQDLIHYFAESLPSGVTQLVAIESRGFIFGSALAHHLGIGMVLVRKPGKLPRETFKFSYELEYGSDTLEVHKDSLSARDKVIIIDDVLATGGTAMAVEELCRLTGAEVLGHRFLMEITALNGRQKLKEEVQSLLR